MVNFVHNIKTYKLWLQQQFRKTPLLGLRKKPKYKVMKNGKQNLRPKRGKTKQSQWDLIKGMV